MLSTKFIALFVSGILISFGLFFFTHDQTLAVKGENAPSPSPKTHHVVMNVLPHRRVCDVAKDGDAECNAHVVTDKNGTPQTATLPYGYGPQQFLGAYNVTSLSAHPILAIVDAYDDPNIKANLDTYNSTYGLPYFPNCSGSITNSSTACFQKVNQNGAKNYPRTNAGWALEISLDVEVAHAVCPSCRLLLVEASSNSFSNLMAAVDRARVMGATAISNSYGANEFNGETTYDSHFNHPGIAYTFSSGDSGYGTEYPAASRYVTAVGGTTLNVLDNGDGTFSYSDETVWNGTGSGCSLYETKQPWQIDSGCNKRMVVDVSADADPSTGAAVYDTVPYYGQIGWYQVGGTSLASPIIAAMYALKGVPANTAANSLPYNNLFSLNDVLSGSNGSCTISYFCNAGSGYDGPTGLGSPNGINAF